MKNDLRIRPDKLQVKMAENFMDPPDLCAAAEISYAAYRRIIQAGRCRIAVLGRLARALKCEVLDLIERTEGAAE